MRDKPQSAALALTGLLAGSIFTCPPAGAASFDCAKAATLVETAICSNQELSTLDDSLTSVYQKAIRRSQTPDTLKEAQRAWLKRRNACQNTHCIKVLYKQRLAELTAAHPGPQRAAGLQLLTRPGDCMETTIDNKQTRFEGSVPGQPGGEIAVSLAAGVGLYITAIPHLSASQDQDVYMARTRDFAVGDRVRLCLDALPDDCPPGDDRGKVYTVTNLKNQLTFTGIDSWHSCGGA